MTHHRKLLIQMAAMLAALPVLYIASSGPVLRLSTRNPAAERRACAFYEPLFRLTTRPDLGPPTIAYLRLWDVTAVDFGDQITQWVILTPRP